MENLIQQILSDQSLLINNYPDRKKVRKFIKRLFAFLFPSQEMTKKALETEYLGLKKDLQELLVGIKSHEKSTAISYQFFMNICETRKILLQDAAAIHDFDPAARSISEVVNTYPGFFAITVYRIANILYLLNVDAVPRIFTEYAHAITGIDIHPFASIGHPFCIDHGTGVVIGETTVIGNNVKLFQGVTLGALSVSKQKSNFKRHPNIEDDVIIYSGATILGGTTVIGKGSVIGGNVWLTESVEANSKVFNANEIKIQEQQPLN